MWVERLQPTAQTSNAVILPIHFTSIFFFSFPECYFVTPLAHCCACCGECKKGRNFANSSRRHSRCSEWSHSLVRLDVARVQVLCQVGLFHFAREAGEEAGCCRRAVYTRRQLSENKQAVAGQRSRRSRSVYVHVYTRARANLYLLYLKNGGVPPTAPPVLMMRSRLLEFAFKSEKRIIDWLWEAESKWRSGSR